MKILLLGKNGQVGWELQRSLMPLGEVIALDRSQCDLSHPETIPSIVQNIKPDIIVNAAAYTAVDKAEEEEELATAINSISVGVLAEEARKLNALLVYFSTDYVFDGLKNTPYTEEDATNPLSAYGRSKLAGEKTIQASGCRYLIFRTSWVFASRGSNFIKTMLRLAAEREELKVVADQIGSPTSAELIADITALVIQQLIINPQLIKEKSGIYHLAASGKTNWHGYAQHVLKVASNLGHVLKVLPEQVVPIATADFPMPAKRPMNSCLDTSKLHLAFGLTLPDWQHYVDRALTEILKETGAFL